MTMAKGILVTGGAGYIGSHVVRQLGERGERVISVDDLSTGFAEAVLFGELVVGDVGDAALMRRLIHDHGIDTVMHFAARTIVPESIEDPLRYYHTNVCATRALLAACDTAGIKSLVFSSSAAVYGVPAHSPVAEDDPAHPINPYGTSKLVGEWMLRDLDRAGLHGILVQGEVQDLDPSLWDLNIPEGVVLVGDVFANDVLFTSRGSFDGEAAVAQVRRQLTDDPTNGSEPAR